MKLLWRLSKVYNLRLTMLRHIITATYEILQRAVDEYFLDGRRDAMQTGTFHGHSFREFSEDLLSRDVR
jgi:hypothetical protein